MKEARTFEKPLSLVSTILKVCDSYSLDQFTHIRDRIWEFLSHTSSLPRQGIFFYNKFYFYSVFPEYTTNSITHMEDCDLKSMKTKWLKTGIKERKKCCTWNKKREKNVINLSSGSLIFMEWSWWIHKEKWMFGFNY